MIEYPSIQNSSKAPRKSCIAFNKADGSNFRAKWTNKKSFSVFGTRTQLIDETTPYWGTMVEVFKNDVADKLHNIFKTEFRNEREIIAFGEFLGENSFAGTHENEPHRIITFDILVGHKLRKFLKPQEFIKLLEGKVEIPEVIYRGNLNDEFISSIRQDENLKEGVICKGTETAGNSVGGVWMCKIKTQKYLDKLKEVFQADWLKYAE